MSPALKPKRGGWYKLRDGTIARITGQRDALKLDGKTTEPIWYGKFEAGGLCAWNMNGTYRASSGKVEHPLDIMHDLEVPA